MIFAVEFLLTMVQDDFNSNEFINTVANVMSRVTTTTTPESCRNVCEANSKCWAAYYDTVTATGAIVSCLLYASREDLENALVHGDTRTNAVKGKYVKELCKFGFHIKF